MRSPKLLPCLFALMTLSGCASYSYNNEKYSSASDALAGQQRYLEGVANDVAVLPTSISGTAIVITPSKETCEALGVTKSGAPRQEFIDYAATNEQYEFANFYKYLEKSKAFSRVESRIVDHPLLEARNVSASYVATIYLHMVSPSQVGWYMLTPGAKEPKQINFDATAAPGAPKINSWIKSIVDNMSKGN